MPSRAGRKLQPGLCLRAWGGSAVRAQCPRSVLGAQRPKQRASSYQRGIGSGAGRRGEGFGPLHGLCSSSTAGRGQRAVAGSWAIGQAAPATTQQPPNPLSPLATLLQIRHSITEVGSIDDPESGSLPMLAWGRDGDANSLGHAFRAAQARSSTVRDVS